MSNLQIEIVSDVMCPWCIVGYKGLASALEKLSPEIQADINWLPFELNPQMPPEGQDMEEHIMEKYGITKEQSAENRAVLTQRGKDVDFEFNFSETMRMINSFDLHRLLAWAKEQGKQNELQMVMFDAHFTDNLPLDNHDNLLKLVGDIGLDTEAAKEVLNSDAFAQQVREEQRFSLENGISSVPSFIINRKHLISGGQSAETFEQALKQIAQEQ
ncbi:DsbA family oxidoreductase [Leucothrix sargassi]|nr:DsbA family oxidoreductase [Leucothrix sargassi]